MNETERILRKQISDIYNKYPSAEKQAQAQAQASSIAPSPSKSKEQSESIPRKKTLLSPSPTYLKRGDPLHCPGNLGTPGHECPSKTKFFPCGIDKIERCRECHEQTMRFHGAKIQQSQKTKKNVEPVRIILKY